MATNHDILAFLKSEKEDRAKEKEEEKVIRVRERQEDLEKIKILIKTGVKEEVNAAVEPLKEELRLQVKETTELRQETNDLKCKFEAVMKEVETLKETSKQYKSDQYPCLPEASNLSRLLKFGAKATPTTSNSSTGIKDPEYNRKVYDLCTEARKIVGFTPIEPRMLAMQMDSFGAQTQEQAMHMEIKSYLKCELKMLPSEVQKLDILDISPPPGRQERDTLYVKFGSEYQVDKEFQHTKYMKELDHRVVHWFPQQMKERREALEKIAFEIRDADRVNKTRTRIRVGRDDLEFSTKSPGGRWTRQVLPHDLPPIDMLNSLPQVQTLSPPPGRPGMKRQNSPESEDDDTTKKARNISPPGPGQKKAQRNLEKHSMVDLLDKGQFTGLEAYSPSTPAKARDISETTSILDSPVFHTRPARK